MRQTKIVATLGPASDSDSGIRELIDAGVNVFRLNFSHGTRDSHAATIARVRSAADASGRTIAILQDLSGPKIRTGRLKHGSPVTLRQGASLVIAVGDFAGDGERVSTTYADLPRAVHSGDTLLLDDGRIQLTVEDAGDRELRATVVDGGVLGEHKGINVPGGRLPSVGLTPKDEADLQFGIAAGVDMVALSFVQTADDLNHARAVLRDAGADSIPLIAKLERPEAIAEIEAILAVSDAVMVARGDLGLELPLERVPRVQKEITRKARALGIPVILATQVLESMREELRPTRAEVSDAANAVDEGVDAIMLAGETAVGKHPARVVSTLDRIIQDAEGIESARVPLERTQMVAPHGRAICEAAVTLANLAEASAIVAVTRAGHTAQMLSALRPRTPIHAVTGSVPVSRRLALAWGVHPIVEDLGGDITEAASRIGEKLVASGVIPGGSVLVIVSVSPDLRRESLNFLKLQRV